MYCSIIGYIPILIMCVLSFSKNTEGIQMYRHYDIICNSSGWYSVKGIQVRLSTTDVSCGCILCDTAVIHMYGKHLIQVYTVLPFWSNLYKRDNTFPRQWYCTHSIRCIQTRSLSSVPMGIDTWKIARRKYLTTWWTPVSVWAWIRWLQVQGCLVPVLEFFPFY